MAFRVGLIVLMVALVAMQAMVAHSTDFAIDMGSIAVSVAEPDGHGLVEDALDLDEETLMESESARRQMRGRRGFVSYGALARNKVPCNKRGQSYYNCRSRQRANPYRRGCTRASRCARNNR